MATKKAVKKNTKKVAGGRSGRSGRSGSIGASVGGRELSVGRATGSVARDLMQNRGPNPETFMRAAAAAEKSSAGTVLRLQRVLERVLQGVKTGTLPPIDKRDGHLSFNASSPDYAGIRFGEFFAAFRRNASRSEPFVVEVLSISAISPADAASTVAFEEKQAKLVVEDSAKVLEIYTSDPLKFVEGPWFDLLDKKIVAMNQEIDDQLSNDPKAREAREQKEQNEREFRDSFVREHGLSTGI